MEGDDAYDELLSTPLMIFIVHDAENCNAPGATVKGGELYHLVVRNIISSIHRDAPPEIIELLCHRALVSWTLVPHSDVTSPYRIPNWVISALQVSGVRIVQASRKRDGVDTAVRQELNLIAEMFPLFQPQVQKQIAVVLISGDGDYAGVIRRLNRLTPSVYLIHGTNASAAFRAQVPRGHSLPIWFDVVKQATEHIDEGAAEEQQAGGAKGSEHAPEEEHQVDARDSVAPSRSDGSGIESTERRADVAAAAQSSDPPDSSTDDAAVPEANGSSVEGSSLDGKTSMVQSVGRPWREGESAHVKEQRVPYDLLPRESVVRVRLPRTFKPVASKWMFWNVITEINQFLSLKGLATLYLSPELDGNHLVVHDVPLSSSDMNELTEHLKTFLAGIRLDRYWYQLDPTFLEEDVVEMLKELNAHVYITQRQEISCIISNHYETAVETVERELANLGLSFSRVQPKGSWFKVTLERSRSKSTDQCFELMATSPVFYRCQLSEAIVNVWTAGKESERAVKEQLLPLMERRQEMFSSLVLHRREEWLVGAVQDAGKRHGVAASIVHAEDGLHVMARGGLAEVRGFFQEIKAIP